MSLSMTTPTALADMIVRECGHARDYPALPVWGARNAARHIASKLESQSS
jgi:hypothetical protein